MVWGGGGGGEGRRGEKGMSHVNHHIATGVGHGGGGGCIYSCIKGYMCAPANLHPHPP